MSVRPTTVRISPTSLAPEVKANSSPAAVAQNVAQRITESVSAAFASLEKSVPKEQSDAILDPIQIAQQSEGKIFQLDSSAPLYDDDSHVFVYFMLAMIFCAVGYIVFHNKRKILALIIEGRQAHGDVRRSGGVNYKRLNTEPPGVSVA